MRWAEGREGMLRAASTVPLHHHRTAKEVAEVHNNRGLQVSTWPAVKTLRCFPVAAAAVPALLLHINYSNSSSRYG
jgi:hypothetical protein